MVADKNIKVSQETQDKMDKIKVHERETYDDIIVRLINGKKLNKQ